MNIPLLDLKAQYQSMRSEILAAIEATCDEEGFILGPRVVALEQAVATYTGSAHGIGVASGSDALLLALMALGVKAGDEVVTVPFTFFVTAGAISRLGAKPVFIDIRPDDFNMDPALLERAITKRTKAIPPAVGFPWIGSGVGHPELAREGGRIELLTDTRDLSATGSETRPVEIEFRQR